ncbi:hypothetical protein [Pediococcus acidilactici]|uniref:hypothetical protein n=1 Tax=Pediococcus acidilactici TaxID=1254 RepID=UPI001BD3DA40|nr:hypothetical protein [Pediococcus acidilactici]MBS9399977.1 hypothetical protein [Pediococcus acidilactici]
MNEQVTILSPEQMAVRIEKYMKDNADEIDVMINKKIKASINRAIKDAFQTADGYGRTDGTAEQAIKKTITAEIEKATSSIVIDQGELVEQINRKLQKKLSSVSVKVNVSM